MKKFTLSKIFLPSYSGTPGLFSVIMI